MSLENTSSPCVGSVFVTIHVGGSGTIQNFMSHDLSSIKIEVCSNGKTHRLLKLVSSSTNVQVITN